MFFPSIVFTSLVVAKAWFMSAVARSSEIFLPLAIVFKNSVPAIWKLQQKQRQQLWFLTTIFDPTSACQKISCKLLLLDDESFTSLGTAFSLQIPHALGKVSDRKCKCNIYFAATAVIYFKISDVKTENWSLCQGDMCYHLRTTGWQFHFACGGNENTNFHWISKIQSGRFEICHFVRLRNEISESM